MSSPEDLLRDNQVLIPLCTVAQEAYSHPSVSSLMGALSVKPWAPFPWIQLTRASNTSLVIYQRIRDTSLVIFCPPSYAVSTL